MDKGSIGRILTVVLLICIVLSYFYHEYHGRNRIGKRAIIKLAIATSLTLLGAALVIHRPFSWEQRSICITSLCYGVVLAYLGIEQQVNCKLSQPYAKHLFLLVSLFSILEIYLIYSERNNLSSFVDNEPFEFSYAYYAYYFLFYAFQAIMEMAIIMVFWIGFENFEEIEYQVICLIAAVSTMTFLILNIIGETAVTLSFLGNENYKYANNVYQVVRPLPFLTMLPLFLSAKKLTHLAGPLTNYLKNRQEHHHELIKRLHQIVIVITWSNYRVMSELLSFRRMLVEITDARALLWSNFPHTQPLAVDREARAILDLLQTNKVIGEYGPYPLPPKRYNTIRHNLAVIRQINVFRKQDAIRLHDKIEVL